MTQVQTKDSRVFNQTIQRLDDWKAELEVEIDKKYSSLKEIDYKVLVAKRSIMINSLLTLESKYGIDELEKGNLAVATKLKQKINEDFQKADDQFKEKDAKIFYEIENYKEIIKEIENYIQELKK